MHDNTPYDIQGYTTYHYESLSSTADMAKHDMFQCLDKYIVVADSQYAGRGRLGNVWQGGLGNLLFNMVTYLPMPMHRWSEHALVIALALSDVISNLLISSQQVHLKWPNDILVNGAKIAGILLETVHINTDKPKLSIGIGLNVVSSPIVKSYQTCYVHHFGVVATASDILPMIVDRYQQWVHCWQTHGLQSIVSLWMARAWGVGTHIRVRTPQQHIHGIFVGLSESGALLLQTKMGLRTINAGEVIFG